MAKASIYDLVGVDIDDGYPWINTLFVTRGVASLNEKDYIKCQSFIRIKKLKRLLTADCRDIGGGILISPNAFIDLNYGVRIDRQDSVNINLSVTQECNEWLIFCVQLLLLELGCTFIHAAALEKNGEVVLLPSWGGVGKTATVVRMIQEGQWRLLGDDLVVLKGNEILPYLKPFVIYPYHKSLFPTVFKEKERRIVTNLKISNSMSQVIPLVKKIMRPVPRLLAFARKHNPQSMRVSPMKIFKKEQLSQGGRLIKAVWLERTMEKKVVFGEKSAALLASKTVSVTMMEIFAERLRSVFVLCGTGVFDYSNIYMKMYDLIILAYQQSSCFELDIPKSVPIEEVGGVVIKHLDGVRK